MKYNHDKQTDRAFFDRYLRILGVQKKEVSFDSLGELITAHLARIPFENISKLYYFKREDRIYFPGPHRYLEGIEKNHFGGTCYTNNYYFNLLLKYLGYDVRLCGADMSEPDVHIVSMVNLDGREYIVDVGYAAPFYRPLPRDPNSDHEISLGKMKYIVKPRNGEDKTRVERYYDGELLHGYTAKPIEREIDFFAPAIEDSFSKASTFMNNILLVSYGKNSCIRLENMKLISASGGSETVKILGNAGEAAKKIEELFGIPEEISLEAFASIGKPGEFKG